MTDPGGQSGPLARRRRPAVGPVVDRRGSPRPEFDEGPSEADLERFSGVTTTCPACGAELHDDVDLCYRCGHALGARVHDGEGVPRWVIVAAVVAAAGLLILFVLA